MSNLSGQIIKIGGRNLSWTDTIYSNFSLLFFGIFVIPLQLFSRLKKSSKDDSKIKTTWVKRSNKNYVKTSGQDILRNIRNCSNKDEFLKLARLYFILIPILLLKSRSQGKSNKSINPDIYMH